MLQTKIKEESKARLAALDTALKAARVAVRDTKKAELLERTRRVKTKVWESVTEACGSSGWNVDVQIPAEELAPRKTRGSSPGRKKKKKGGGRRKTKAQIEDEAYARGLLEGAKKTSRADGGKWTRWGTQRDKYARNRVADGPKQWNSEDVEKLKQKIRAASYTFGGQDWDKLFSVYDKNGDGILNYDEFAQALRRGQLTKDVILDMEMVYLYSLLDTDRDNHVSIQEFKSWLGTGQ